MVLRPARDALGMRSGLDAIRWLFIGTAVVTLAVNPMFGWLVSRFRRLVFITATYGFFAVSLVGFYALIALAPAAVGEVSGRVFYVWFSVFNLFSTMVFWALMADRFTLEQSKRHLRRHRRGRHAWRHLRTLARQRARSPAGNSRHAAGFRGLPRPCDCGRVGRGVAATGDARGARSAATAAEPAIERAVIGGNAWAGISAVFKSPYLLGISTYVLLMTITATFIYFTRLQMVAALGNNTDMRATVLAQIDLVTQVATLVLQAVVTGHLMKRLGVAVALAILPVVVSLGFIGLAIAGSFVVLVLFDATFRAIQRAITRPARETLFTVVTRRREVQVEGLHRHLRLPWRRRHRRLDRGLARAARHGAHRVGGGGGSTRGGVGDAGPVAWPLTEDAGGRRDAGRRARAGGRRHSWHRALSVRHSETSLGRCREY